MEQINKLQCPLCKKNTLEVEETKYNIPSFGPCFLMSMSCTECLYHQSDIESEETKDPIKLTFELNSEKDLQVRVIKSGRATLKIPQLRMSVAPGTTSIGYISNVEGVLRRFKVVVEQERDAAEDNSVKKTAKNLLKKFWKIENGELPIKIVIEDPTGNSAILSDKTTKEKLKVPKKK
ncbi:hypothetical protein CL617_00430 [archaeon]|nr:hypothetical protein [archaeon]|tara:strand:+ start:2713 stop:3246 length:534 start_codon:yes stop_codon:yes gene_type:complete